jgi:hypothetical protein
MRMKNGPRLALIVLAAVLLSACGPPDMLWPSDRIGPMWVNRYGHSNSQPIWEYCDDRMSAGPGVRTVDCSVPWVDELFIGYGVRAQDRARRDALWEARAWELYIDGHAVDLPAFNVADFNAEVDGALYAYRVWRVRLRQIPAGEHTLHYVMRVEREIEDDPESQAPGTYELVVNFTFEAK